MCTADATQSSSSAIVTTMLVVGAVAASVLLGTGGGAVTPPLHLESDDGACTRDDPASPCTGGTECTHAGGSAPAG